jgi:hypothetical protein
MLLKEYMEKVAAAEATGEYAGRDMVLAVDCTDSGNANGPESYAFVGVHIEDLGAALNQKSEDHSYVLEGDATIKTTTQRTFSITGTRYISDGFQDFCCKPEIKFGNGSAVQRNYVYFHSGTKSGEQGILTILVENDGGAGASDPAEFQVEMKSCGTPKAYTYTA